MNALKTKISYLRILQHLCLLGVLYFQSCARPGTLGGGPKDATPPQLLAANPPQYSRKVNGSKAVLLFDEFLSLQNVNQELIISPSIYPKPEVVLRGKKLFIKQNKQAHLQPNTTYTFSFGNAIGDLHENNALANFQYVFATGENIDTLSIRGRVVEAQTLLPQEHIMVGLYKASATDSVRIDSLPYVQPPFYLARVDKNGDFQLNNLGDDRYLLFAIEDKNANGFFDMPSERIAFVDSLLSPQPLYDYIPDSIAVDTANNQLMDSLWEYHASTTVLNTVSMFLFQEKQQTLQLLESKIENANKISLFFKPGLPDSLSLDLISHPDLHNWCLPEYNLTKDTVVLWLKQPMLDTLQLRLTVDSVYADTLQFVSALPNVQESKVVKRSGRKKDTEPEEQDIPSVAYRVLSSSTHHYAKPLRIRFDTPMANAQCNFVRLWQDSLEVTAMQIRFLDSIHRYMECSYAWQPSKAYKLIIPQGALQDIYGLSNDSIEFSFTTTSPDDYGSLALSFEGKANAVYVLSLEQGKANDAKTLKSFLVKGDTILSIKDLSPGDYYLKAVEDTNENGEWDTGDYGAKRQPEAVYYCPKAIKIKAMWKTEEKWTPKDGDRKTVP